MRYRPSLTLVVTVLVTISALVLAPEVWSQDSTKKKKKKNKSGSSSVTKVIKKVDQKILSYSPEQARALLDPVMEEKDPRVDAAMGQILMLEQDYEGAAAKLQAASKNSDDPWIQVALGDARAYAKDKGGASAAYGKAAAEAEALLGKDPSDTGARLALGVAQQRLQRYDEAAANLTRAKGEDASNPRASFELGMTKMLQGDNQAAFDQLSRAIELYSGYAYAYYYRAQAANKIGRQDVAVNDLDRFLRVAPEAPEAPKASRLLESWRG